MTFRLILILLSLCVFANTANARVASGYPDERTLCQIVGIGESSDEIINGETMGADDEPFVPQSLFDTSSPYFVLTHSNNIERSHKSFIRFRYNIRAPPL